mgnify:CR=1 FL=1
MNIEPTNVINTITRFAAPHVIDKAKRNGTVIKILKHLKIDPAHPPEDFYGVYAYALVEYALEEQGKNPNQFSIFSEKKRLEMLFGKLLMKIPQTLLTVQKIF